MLSGDVSNGDFGIQAKFSAPLANAGQRNWPLPAKNLRQRRVIAPQQFGERAEGVSRIGATFLVELALKPGCKSLEHAGDDRGKAANKQPWRDLKWGKPSPQHDADRTVNRLRAQ